MDARPELYRHILLSGGTTMFPGFSTRLQHDLQSLYRQRILQGDPNRKGLKIRVSDTSDRMHAVWAGGSVLAEIMAKNDAWWISREDWIEKGPAACMSRLQR